MTTQDMWSMPPMSATTVGIAVPTIRPSSIDSSIAIRTPSRTQRMFFGTTGVSSAADAVVADMTAHPFRERVGWMEDSIHHNEHVRTEQVRSSSRGPGRRRERGRRWKKVQEDSDHDGRSDAGDQLLDGTERAHWP
ncbi:hypothetical protein [Streptomyces sp. uw30]|uniref:hypothetical protein n=1 Tax=Streptomyces sp. uw30 TaxID=1828179 RepID=UPI00165158DF|nr:hypothetical protein [Streptomyces sp. uw30]